MVGYSATPLVKKLGIKPHSAILLINEPPNYLHLVAPLPEGVTVKHVLNQSHYDFIHFFTSGKEELGEMFVKLKQALKQDGTLWISWPKESAKRQADLNENTVREIGLKYGLVDVKVCAIDETWSGLKFVYRIKDRS